VAAHFGYSLGVGAIPVKKFRYTDKHRDGSKKGRDVVLPAGHEISAALSSPFELRVELQ